MIRGKSTSSLSPAHFNKRPHIFILCHASSFGAVFALALLFRHPSFLDFVSSALSSIFEQGRKNLSHLSPFVLSSLCAYTSSQSRLPILHRPACLLVGDLRMPPAPAGAPLSSPLVIPSTLLPCLVPFQTPTVTPSLPAALQTTRLAALPNSLPLVALLGTPLPMDGLRLRSTITSNLPMLVAAISMVTSEFTTGTARRVTSVQSFRSSRRSSLVPLTSVSFPQASTFPGKSCKLCLPRLGHLAHGPLVWPQSSLSKRDPFRSTRSCASTRPACTRL